MADTDAAASLCFEGFTLDLAARTLVDASGREVALRRSEFELLRALLAAPGRALSRDHLLDAVAGRRSEPFDRSVDVLIGRLRRKIEPEPGAARLIVTVPGVGYRFAVKPQTGPFEGATEGAAGGTGAPSLALPTTTPERRQLTVLRCCLCGPALSAARRDPEDLQRLLAAFHARSDPVIAEAGGTTDRLLDDGILAYFGYPQADEHQAERAIRAALKLVERASQIDTGQFGRLHLRVGVATGLAVAGGQPAALGEAARLAAGLASRAEPGAVLIAASTRRLVGELFALCACERADAATAANGADDEPLIEAWAVEGMSAAESRFESVHGGGRLTTFVGRAHELGLLLERWQLARDGEGQVVLLSGEPGIGKSRILRELREQLGQEDAGSLRFQCSPHHVNSAFHPVIDYFERALRSAPNENQDGKLDRLEALVVGRYGRPREDVRFIAAMLSLPHSARHGVAPAMTPRRFKDETLRALVDTIAAIARRAPAVMLFEDAHWADPTTLEAMDLLVHRVRGCPLLVVVTHRPEFPSRWSHHGHVTALSLAKLTRAQGAAMVFGLTEGKTLPADLLEQILGKTEGVPLFVEELTKSVLESAGLTDAGDRWEHAAPAGGRLAIPPTLRDSLMARLDRCAPAKEIAQIGAAIGREFSHELIAAVAPNSKQELGQALARLTASGLAFQQGTPPSAVYTFKHVLVRDTAYDSLLKQRRQELHGKIARAIETRLPDTEATQPELLAHHYTEAKRPEKAVSLWQKAASLALGRVALAEAVAHLTCGLETLAGLPSGAERRRRELGLQLALGQASLAARGVAAPETGRAYARARELCREVGDDAPEFFPALYGRFIVHFQRGELAVAHEAARELLRLAEDAGDTAACVTGHRIVGAVLCHLGHLIESRAHLEAGLALYEPERDRGSASVYALDSRVVCQFWLIHVLLVLGYPEQARTRMQELLACARGLGHPYTLAYALSHVCVFHGRHRPGPEARSDADALVAFAKEQGFPVPAAVGTVVGGWALTGAPGMVEEGIVRMRRGLADYMATGAERWVPDFLALLAQAQGRAGRPTAGLELLAEALDRVAGTGSRWIEAELHRLRGELMLLPASGDPDQAAAAACFQRAAAVAREQEARMWELRAAVSLARVWRDQGRRPEAHDLLAPICGWFTEGFGTKDLEEAKALLDVLEIVDYAP